MSTPHIAENTVQPEVGEPGTVGETTSQLAARLTRLSREQAWDVYSEFEWPETLTGDRYCMPAELISVYGTEIWDELNDQERRRLSLFEIGNFFSLTLQGERPLVAGLSDRLYSKKVTSEATEYLHHFIDEENKHMIMFGLFLQKYLGKVYPEKKVALSRSYKKGEEEIAFFCKVMVVEELGDYYNVKMMLDDTIEPIVKRLNWVHHRDESRHLGFGRRHLTDLAAQYVPTWAADDRREFEDWLAAYLRSSWNDFYNPSMYKDAGFDQSGNRSGYAVRRMALAHPSTAVHRAKASKKLVNIFLRLGLLREAPAL